MPHPSDLIQKIKQIVERDYPPAAYRYDVEVAIPGTRMHPDILVRDVGDNVVCAVEIGYTRPEKLTAYRDRHKIADVRWYDKQGNLHADVKEVSVALTVTAEPVGRVRVYHLNEAVSCADCVDEDLKSEGFERDDDNFTEAYCKALCDAEAFSYEDVETILLTDFVKAWFACFCDKCGRHWFAGEDDDPDISHIMDALRRRSGHEFALEISRPCRRNVMDECVELVRSELGMEIKFEDGVFLDPDGEQAWSDAIVKVRRKTADDQAAIKEHVDGG